MPLETRLARLSLEVTQGYCLQGIRSSVSDTLLATNRFQFLRGDVAAVVEWYRYRIVVCFVTSSSSVPLKTRRVGQRCTLNLSRVETSSRWCGS
ncbi:histone-lysine N-methyltransferase SETMAR [Trichonephila clavipes]|nr:histone-lysine N-methyltransferase SETMAR [Trichonephila clavipes]